MDSDTRINKLETALADLIQFAKSHPSNWIQSNDDEHSRFNPHPAWDQALKTLNNLKGGDV